MSVRLLPDPLSRSSQWYRNQAAIPSVLAGVGGAALVSFLVATPLLRIFGKDEDIQDAIDKTSAMKDESKGKAVAAIANPKDIKNITFACDAGMGSSAMGATVLQKELEKAGRGDIKVGHASVSDIPSDAQIVVTHQDLKERAAHSAPQAELVLITNFMNAPEYKQLAQRLSADAAPAEEAPAEAKAAEKTGILQKKNIKINQTAAPENDVIRAAGQMLVDSGCVDPEYIDAMILREDSFATNIGNGIAIPHGVEEAKRTSIIRESQFKPSPRQQIGTAARSRSLSGSRVSATNISTSSPV